MTTIERSNVAGVFASREQAEQAVEALRKVGFCAETVGLAGQAEVREKLYDQQANMEANEPRMLEGELVALAVRAEERWQEALTILRQYGAFDTTPTLQESEEDGQGRRQELAGAQTVSEEHLEYDPITGPRVVREEIAPAAYSGEFGLKRDPDIDSEASTRNPYVQDDNTAQRQEKTSFFSGTRESNGPDAERGKAGEPPRVR